MFLDPKVVKLGDHLNVTTAPDWTPLSRQQAVDLGWTGEGISDGPNGWIFRSTIAFESWQMVDHDQRAYLHLTLRWIGDRFEHEWNQINSEPGWDGQPEPIDVLFDRIGLLPHDHDWMTLAGVLRDGVSAYEVYLGSALNEVLRAHGHPHETLGYARRAAQLGKDYSKLGLHFRGSGVEHVVELRNILTHARGELRTEEERAKFADKAAYGDEVAHLTEESVLAHLGTLATNIREMDPVLWAYAYTDVRVPGLLPQA